MNGWVITGGCGFVGTNLADALLTKGEDVIILDNLSKEGSIENLHWLRQRLSLGIQISEINLLFLAGHYPGNTDGVAIIYLGWRATDFPVFESCFKS